MPALHIVAGPAALARTGKHRPTPNDNGRLHFDVGLHKAVAAGKGARPAQRVAMAKEGGRCPQISIEVHKEPVFVFLPDTFENKPPMFVGSC